MNSANGGIPTSGHFLTDFRPIKPTRPRSNASQIETQVLKLKKYHFYEKWDQRDLYFYMVGPNNKLCEVFISFGDEIEECNTHGSMTFGSHSTSGIFWNNFRCTSVHRGLIHCGFGFDWANAGIKIHGISKYSARC